MKKFILTLVSTVIFISLISFTESSPRKVDNEGKKIEIVFSHKLSFNDIVKMKLDLSERNICLTFRKLGFDENSMLTSVDYLVKVANYSAADQLENLTDDSHWGFIINQSDENKWSISAGNLGNLSLSNGELIRN